MKYLFKTIVFLVLLFVVQPNSVFSQVQKTDSTANSEDKDDDENKEEENIGKGKKEINLDMNIGLEGGFNFSSMKFKNSKSSSKPGVRVGGLFDIPATNRIFLQPGIFYAINGGSDVINDNSSKVYKLNINSVEIPFNAIYKFGTKHRNHIYAGTGLCYGYYFSGKFNPGGIKLNIGSSDTDELKHHNLSFGLNFGYEMYNGLFFRFNSLTGLLDLNPRATSNSIRMSGWGIQVGYYFYKKVF